MRGRAVKKLRPGDVDQFTGRLRVEYLPLSELKLDANNPRTHSTKQLGQIAASINTFGFIVPVLIDSTRQIIAGHGRVMAAWQLGWTEVPTISVHNLSEAQARAFAIADNRLTENSAWNDRFLAQQLRHRTTLNLDFSLEVTGFEIGEIDLRIESLDLDASENDPADLTRSYASLRRPSASAATRVRFGYRRLTVMLRREGWPVNAKRIYRLYTEDGLAVRTKMRKKIARRSRVPALRATRPNEKWSVDFVAARLLDGRWFRVLTVVDQFTRECLLFLADSSLTGEKVALALSQVIATRGAPVSITVDNGTEFASRAMDVWAYQYRVQLDFIRPGKPVENSYIESFNGRLRDECLNVEVFFTLADVP